MKEHPIPLKFVKLCSEKKHNLVTKYRNNYFYCIDCLSATSYDTVLLSHNGGIMRRFSVLLIASILSVSFLLAQEQAPEQSPAQTEAAAAIPVFSQFEKGDILFSLSAGTALGLGFYNPTTGSFDPANLKPSFTILLALQRFITPNIVLGGEIAGYFFATINDRQFFLAPLGARIGYAFDLNPFFIIPTVSLGAAIMRLNDMGHIDPYIKTGAVFGWSPSQEVCYTIHADLMTIPQFYSDSTQNRTGLFLDLIISATYHF